MKPTRLDKVVDLVLELERLVLRLQHLLEQLEEALAEIIERRK